MTFLKKCIVAAVFVAMLAAALAGGVYFWANRPMTLTPAELDVTIKPHSSLRSVSAQLNRGGVPVEPELFVLMTRALGLSAQLKSGNYAFKSGVTPYEVLQKIARGDVNEYVATVIEGWTLQKMRSELDGNPALAHDTAGMSDIDILKAIGAAETDKTSAEGLFFPDTYLFDKGTSDLAVYKRAYRTMQRRLEEAWSTRAPNLPYKTPYDALIMASIVEKETGRAADRPLVAAVFANRLRIGMPLQTDPTVIYGLGPAYGGHLKKKDLQTDTPYNTYTRMGLPPTPIALPGVAALTATLNPAASNALYFVSRGDGSSFFSDNLGDHNKAVDKYIRGQ
ncbi:endolytic transglycosylase MltG [Caballeronia concitans]|uniref:Endolytic murein transglycosylase n=1 Tax=Caballeronia concitans TaxID=1777133 RepID=A0A658QYA1_9BURK|nr:endolytic transglycosylase MltG [Caballeronia concitans]KIG11409.1 aminodeoxychorismate lyase [Burkholderia sp. MR1]SAL32786.1 aminodeoxychorismate lyase [Caballeronia concitans]